MDEATTTQQTRFIKLPKVEATTSLKKPTIYRMIKEGKFPRPVKLNKRSVAWVECEVLDWQEKKMAARG